MINPVDNLQLAPFYQTAHAQITEPTRFVAISHYYRRRWLKQVGPVGTAILLELRGRCYNNPTTGERRDVVVASQKDLADCLGISVDTLQRQLGRPGRDEDLKANQSLRNFVWMEERFERSHNGRVRQLENIYHVAMDDPIHPDDFERFDAIVSEYTQADQETRQRQQSGRKNILPPLPATELSEVPEPQFAVLRGSSPDADLPEPQTAAGGHRNLRQGSPQIAALSEESLLFVTEGNSDSTLNVEGANNFVAIPDSAPKNSRKRSTGCSEPSRHPRSVMLDTLTAALVNELGDIGSEKRHRQLLDICERNGLDELAKQALLATRRRLAQEQEQGVLEKPGAYYQKILVSLLEDHQVFVPPSGSRDEQSQVRQLIKQSLGLQNV